MARRRRTYRQRTVSTVIPIDSVFQFRAHARAEGRAEKAGLRVTIPRPVVRGLHHLGWDGYRLRARIGTGPSFLVRARHPSDLQAVFALPREYRGEVVAGQLLELVVMIPR